MERQRRCMGSYHAGTSVGSQLCLQDLQSNSKHWQEPACNAEEHMLAQTGRLRCYATMPLASLAVCNAWTAREAIPVVWVQCCKVLYADPRAVATAGAGLTHLLKCGDRNNTCSICGWVQQNPFETLNSIIMLCCVTASNHQKSFVAQTD